MMDESYKLMERPANKMIVEEQWSAS